MQKNICVRPLTDIHTHVHGHFLTRMQYAHRLARTDESASNRAQGLFQACGIVQCNSICQLTMLIGPYRPLWSHSSSTRQEPVTLGIGQEYAKKLEDYEKDLGRGTTNHIFDHK